MPPISTVNWLEHNEIMDDLLQQEERLTLHTLDQGFEAEVVRLGTKQESYVLKTWSKNSRPDVQFLYRLLSALSKRGIAVSKPVGWGLDPSGHQVLLTSFDGTPAYQINDETMKELAKILAQIHHIQVEELESIQVPKYPFTDYFFSEVEGHSDINHAITALLPKAVIKQDCIIHGDFHLGNIVEQDGCYTVIDWTNGQLGDARYDFAWALILLRLYVSEHYADVFRSAYLLEMDLEQEELEVFEAWACLRWLLLSRRGSAPTGPDIMKKIKSIINRNRFLHSYNFEG